MKRGLTMVVLASLWLAKCAAAYPATLTVLNFQNRNPGDGYDWLGKAFPDMLLTHFAQHGKFAALEREKMQSLSDELRLQHKAAVNQSAVTEFAGIAKVVKVVYGHYAVERGQLAVTAFILDAETKRVDSVATVTGQLEELCELDKRLFAALLDRLGRPLSNAELAALPCVISGNLSATTQFYRGLEAFDAGDYPLALIEFREAIRQDATYGEARLWVGKIYRALGEFQHAVVTLKKFTQELPRHPAALEAHRLTGLILLQDLKKALLAVPEFEKLAGSEPEGSQPTARLREAHWNEYVLFAKKTNPPFWYTKEQQDADQKEFERLGKLAAERTQRFKLCVEGWRRLGECWQQLGDWRKAFAAHDQARAISRWVLLDTNEPFEINYAAYRAYEKLLAVDDSEVPVPDWVVRANAQPMPLLDGLDPDRVYRYTLIHPRWLLGDFVLLAPEGLQFTNVVAQAHSLSTDFPARFRLCIKNFQTLANWGGSADFFEQPIHCFPYYLGYDFMTNAFTKSFAIPDNHRAIIVRMLGLNWKGRFDSLVVEPSFAPWKKSVADTAPSRPTHCQFAYWPVDARLLVDGKEISPSPEAGLCDLALDPGKHRAELRKDGWEPVDLEVDLPAKSERSFFVSLDSAWKDLGIRLPGCLKPHLSQAANGEFWLVYEIPTGVNVAGKNRDLWLIKSMDLLHWSAPLRLPINSPQDDCRPNLVHRGDGLHVLAFCSDRKLESAYSLYTTSSSDGENWSSPRRLADVSPDEPVSLVADNEDRLWILYSSDADKALRKSVDGRTWDEPRRITVTELPFSTNVNRGSIRVASLVVLPSDELLLVAAGSISNRVDVATFRFSDGAKWMLNNEFSYPDVLYGNEARVNLTDWVWNGGVDWSRPCLTPRGDYLMLGGANDTTYAGLVRSDGKIEPPHTLLRGFSEFSPPIRCRDGRYVICRAVPSNPGTIDHNLSDGTRILVCTESDLERRLPQQLSQRKIFWYDWDQFAYFENCFWRGSSRHPVGLAVRSATTGREVSMQLAAALSGGTSNHLPARITAMRVDGDRLWIGTGGYGLFVHQAKSKAVEEVRPPEDGRCRMISALAIDGERVWAGTEGEGLYSYEKKAGHWEQCGPKAEIGKITALVSSSDQVWVGTSQGLWMLDQHSNQWTTKLDNRPVQCVAALHDHLWIGGASGLVEYDFKTRHFRTVLPVSIRCLLADEESLWIATAAQGLQRMDLTTGELKYVSLDASGYGERPRLDRIKHVVEDGEYLLIGTDHLTEFIREIIRIRKTDAIQHALPSHLQVAR